MIEPTDEMDRALLREADGGPRAAVEAVLAIVERDYHCLERRECGAAGPDGVWCERQPGHDELHGHIRAGELVRW